MSQSDDCASGIHDFCNPCDCECHGRELENLRIALDESIILQAHYAQLLNMHDGGQRKIFHTAKDWFERLKETGTIKDYYG
jgi:hypothetical protein